MQNSTLFQRLLAVPILMLLTFAFSSEVSAQCSMDVTTLDSNICVGDTVTLNAVGPSNSLATTLAAGNNHRGNMFDITALQNVTITGFDCHPMGNTTVAIWYKTGTHVGSEANAASWTFLDSAAVTAAGTGTAVHIPVNLAVPLTAGQTYAFYITSTNTSVSLNYSNGTTRGNVFSSDSYIQFREGSGMEYPFTASGSIFQPRIWNGNIYYSTGGSTVWNTGDTTSTITVAPTTTTTYAAVYSDPMVPCAAGDSITITVTPAPMPNLGPDTVLCAGGSATLDGSVGSGAVYLWSNGDTSSSITINTAGTYSVTATDIGSGCSGMDMINVGTSPGPTVQLNDTTVCMGDSVMLMGDPFSTNPGGSYSWSTGSTSQNISVNMAGNYGLTATDTFGCSANDTMYLFVNDPQVNLGPDTAFCTGSSWLISTGGGFSSYMWSTGDTSQSITVNSAGTYSVTVMDAIGCSDMDDIVITEETAPVASFTATQVNTDTYDFTSTSTGGGTCLWDFGDGSTSSLANPTHTYINPGNYTVTLTCSNMCGSDSTTQSVGIVSGRAEPLSALGVQVYPNPSEGLFTIELLSSGQDELHVRVMDMVGHEVKTVSFSGQMGRNALDLRGMAAGMYLLQVERDGKAGMERIQIR